MSLQLENWRIGYSYIKEKILYVELMTSSAFYQDCSRLSIIWLCFQLFTKLLNLNCLNQGFLCQVSASGWIFFLWHIKIGPAFFSARSIYHVSRDWECGSGEWVLFVSIRTLQIVLPITWQFPSRCFIVIYLQKPSRDFTHSEILLLLSLYTLCWPSHSLLFSVTLISYRYSEKIYVGDYNNQIYIRQELKVSIGEKLFLM